MAWVSWLCWEPGPCSHGKTISTSQDTYARHCPGNTTLTLSDWIAPRALEFTYTAWDLETFAKDCGYDGSPFTWDEERRFAYKGNAMLMDYAATKGAIVSFTRSLSEALVEIRTTLLRTTVYITPWEHMISRISARW